MDDEVSLEAPSLDPGRDPGDVFERREEELIVRGAVGAVAARPRTGGPEGVEDAEPVGFAAGLSHDEKKSSSSPPAADAVAGVATSIPSTNIRVGYLRARLTYRAAEEGSYYALGYVCFDTFREFFLIQLCDTTRILLLGVRVS